MAADFQGHDMNQLHSKFLDGAEGGKCSECDRTGTTRSEEFKVVDNQYFEDLLSRNCTELERCSAERSDDSESAPARDCVHADDVIESFQADASRGLRDFKKNFQNALVRSISDVNEECEELKSEKICFGKVQEHLNAKIGSREIKSDAASHNIIMEENFSREIGSLSYDVTKNYEISNEPRKDSIGREAAVEGRFTDSVANESINSYKLVDGESTKTYGMCDAVFGDDEWDSDGRPTGERWPPLGAPNDDEDNQSLYSYPELNWHRGHFGGGVRDEERLQQLEEEQEQLNNSLMALTSHFAQVQFRLKQIIDASPEEKEVLLQQLEEFANRGIPDIRDLAVCRKSALSEPSEEGEDNIGIARQKELIEQLKQQLDDLENYVYQTGEGGPPQAKVMEKQRIIIEQLKGKLNLNVDEFDKLTVDDLRGQVDHAIRELVNPLKMKEQLVAQLQTQITDLERFIEFLQGEGTGNLETGTKSPCLCKDQPPRHPGDGKPQEVGGSKRAKPGVQRNKSASMTKDKEQLRTDTENIMKRAATLISMLSFGCGANRSRFHKNTLKKTPQGNHYGDLRAALEIAINGVLEELGPDTPADSDYTSDSEETSATLANPEVTIAVRKHLSPALRDLVQHGLMPVGQSQSLVPFLSCIPQRSQKPTKLMHAWDLILKYYHLKKGDQYNRTPARRLSQSFNLEITGGSAVTNKQTLLGVIGNIISSHTPLKRSYDSHFKAFVCAGLNQKKLISWLRLIFRTQTLTENFYQSWSYVSKTGFEDAFRSLERLNKYNFNLPIDLAVRPFQNIKDAF